MMFVLQPGGAVPLPAQLLVVRVHVPPGQPVPRLEAVAATPGPGAGPLDVAAARVLALTVTQPTTVRVRPGDGGVFGPGSVFGLSVQTEGVNGSTVSLQGVDVSGLRQRELVLLTPREDQVVVSAVAQVADLALPPVAVAARIAARERLGVARLPPAQAIPLTVVVDVSASMRPRLAAGEVERALELLVGLAQVVSGPDAPAAALCAHELSSIPTAAPTSWAAEVSGAAAARRAVVGFRSSRVPVPRSGGVTYLVTDAVPADLAPDRPDPLHLVLLGDADPGTGTGAMAEVGPLPAATAVTVLPAVPTASVDPTADAVASLLAPLDLAEERSR
jgi:hypothetical protein